MKLTDLVQKTYLERVATLHDATKGWDKYLVMELLNEYFAEIKDILSPKYKAIEQAPNIDYYHEFYFHFFVYTHHELEILKHSVFYDIPYEEDTPYVRLYEIIEVLENTLIDTLSDKDLQKLFPDKENSLKTAKKDVFEYCRVGVLFAQGLIKKIGFDYIYKDKVFESSNALAYYLKENKIVKIKSVRQLIDATFSASTNSLYNPTKSKNILEYCKMAGITPVQEFYDEIKRFESLQGH